MKMFKHTLILFSIIILSVIFNCSPVLATDIKINMDGEIINTESWDVKPFIQNGRVMVPIRHVSELFDATVGWNESSKVVDISVADKNLRASFPIGVCNYYIGLKGNRSIDVAPYILDGRTILPLRYLAEALCFDVSWDGDNNTVIISSTMLGIDDFNSTEWDLKVSTIAWNNSELLELYLADKEYVREFMYNLYNLKNTYVYTNSVTYTKSNGASCNISQSDNGNIISISHNNIGNSAKIENIALATLIGYKDYIGINGDGLMFTMSEARRSAIESNNNATADIEITGETIKYSYSIKEYNQSGGYFGTCDKREVTIIKK